MSTILDMIADRARARVEAARRRVPLEVLKDRCAALPPADGGAFDAALARPGLSFICEVKKASPSKGVIDPVFDYLGIARAYETAGADAVSCLTEPKWFLGSDAVFSEIRAAIDTPMIRKDFTVDEYQLYESRLLGANAVLLICAILDTETTSRYLEICDRLGLAALVETHNEEEIASAVSAGAKIVGVNNRNLKDFSVDLENAARLRGLIPSDRLYVAESGVTTPDDAAKMKSVGADAVLMGEAMMRAADKGALLAAMRKAAQ